DSHVLAPTLDATHPSWAGPRRGSPQANRAAWLRQTAHPASRLRRGSNQAPPTEGIKDEISWPPHPALRADLPAGRGGKRSPRTAGRKVSGSGPTPIGLWSSSSGL